MVRAVPWPASEGGKKEALKSASHEARHQLLTFLKRTGLKTKKNRKFVFSTSRSAKKLNLRQKIKFLFNLMDALKELVRCHGQYLFRNQLLLHELVLHAISDQQRKRNLNRNEKLITSYVVIQSLPH